jgi:hypothetical protein
MKQRRYRVSAYAPGITNPSASPALHKASQSRENAVENFFAAMKGLGTKYEMVILHQGKGGSNAMKLFLDTRNVRHVDELSRKIELLRWSANNWLAEAED